jgi:hypothetical protein
MVVNFLKNMAIFSLRKRTFSFLGYILLRILGLLLQVLFFESCISILVAESPIEVLTILKTILFLVFSVLFTYYSRDVSITIQNEIIDHLFEKKLNSTKNKKVNWIRPIVVELWNAIDAFIILSLMVAIISYLTSSFVAPIIFISLGLIWAKLGVVYVKKWTLLSGNKNPQEILFWRLRQQNKIESLLLGLIFSMVAFLVLGGYLDDINARVAAIAIVLSRTFITIVTKQISTIPRIARYFANLPEWPQFWKNGKWF